MAKPVKTEGTFDIVIQMPQSTGGSTGETADGGSPSPSNVEQQGKLAADPVSGDNNSQVKLAAALSVAKSLGTQAINAAVSNIGLATGNYYAQEKAQSALSAMGTVAQLAVAARNPVTFIATIGSMAVSLGSEIYKQTKEREHDNYVAAQYARRLGYSVGRR